MIIFILWRVGLVWLCPDESMEHSLFLQTELNPKWIIFLFLKMRDSHKMHETLPSQKNPKIQTLKKSFRAEFFEIQKFS